jgi:hypothetical protein
MFSNTTKQLFKSFAKPVLLPKNQFFRQARNTPISSTPWSQFSVISVNAGQRNISSLTDPASPEYLKQVEDMMKNKKRKTKFYDYEKINRNLNQINTFERANMKFSGHDLAKSNSSVQEMGLYFSNPGKYAERNVGKVQSAAEIKIENILMANPYVDGCYVYKNEDSNLLTAEVILDDSYEIEDFDIWVLNNPALERWGEEVSYDFVEEVSSNCPKAQRNQRSASRIVDLLQEFGTDRSVDITQFASFCEEYSLVKSCKSDQVFSNFDLDQDGLLNYPEFKEFVDSITF